MTETIIVAAARRASTLLHPAAHPSSRRKPGSSLRLRSIGTMDPRDKCGDDKRIVGQTSRLWGGRNLRRRSLKATPPLPSSRQKPGPNYPRENRRRAVMLNRHISTTLHGGLDPPIQSGWQAQGLPWRRCICLILRSHEVVVGALLRAYQRRLLPFARYSLRFGQIEPQHGKEAAVRRRKPVRTPYRHPASPFCR